MKKVKDYKYNKFLCITSIKYKNDIVKIKGKDKRKFYDIEGKRLPFIPPHIFNECEILSVKNTKKIIISKEDINDLNQHNIRILCNSISQAKINYITGSLFLKDYKVYEIDFFDEEVTQINMDIDVEYAKRIYNHQPKLQKNALTFFCDKLNQDKIYVTLNTHNKINLDNQFDKNIHSNGIIFNTIDEAYEGIFFIKLMNSDKFINFKIYKLDGKDIKQTVD